MLVSHINHTTESKEGQVHLLIVPGPQTGRRSSQFRRPVPGVEPVSRWLAVGCGQPGSNEDPGSTNAGPQANEDVAYEA